MKRKKSLLIFLALAGVILIISNTGATTINATSCSQSSLQAAVNSATSGDLIIIPDGNCTWSSAISIPSTKKITLKGAGIDSTVIVTSNALAINTNQSGSRLTGFTFKGGWVQADGDGWRIDHCKFSSESTALNGVMIRGDRENYHPTGLVDHCIFHNTRVVVIGWAGLMANALWAQPLNLGSGDNVVYVEDCTFTATIHTNAMDANYGGRYVFRYNTVNDTYVEAHSVQSAVNRAAMKWEIYNNTFNQKDKAQWVPMFLRGGTGVIFNNTLTGTWGKASIVLNNVRSCPAINTNITQGWCDGSSFWDNNTPAMNGYACRDQIGRSTDLWVWTAANPYPPQTYAPVYAWNNKYGNNDVGFYVHEGVEGCSANAAHIVSNRDFILGQKTEYTPFTYPHPFVRDWEMQAPSNLRISK